MLIICKNSEIKKAVFLNGYNLTTLAKEINIGVSYLSVILNNKKKPSSILAKKIATTLNVEVEDIFQIEKEEA